VEALVAIDGEVVFVGTLAEARRRMPEFAGGTSLRPGIPEMEELDLRGAVAVPGLVDAHAHLFNLGKLASRVTFFGTHSAEECVELAREHAKTLPEDAWVLGRGWDQNDWEDTRFPTRELLDAAFGDRPVLFERVDGHATWANSAALRAAEIDILTPDPEGGEILRDPVTGQPTGLLIDTAEELVWKVVPDPDAAELDRRLRAAMEQALQAGLTGIHEMGSDLDQIAALQRADARGELKLRMVVYLGGDAVLRSWREPPRRPDPDEMLRIEGVKLYMDGALGSRGAALLEDYSDRPGHRGLLATSSEAMSLMVRDAFDRGFSVAIHAIGDAGNRAALDAIARGYRLSSEDDPELGMLPSLRARIEHCQILDPSDLPRFAELGIIPSMQPTHCTSDMPWAPGRLGKQRLVGAYAWRSLRDTGCEIPLGSDAPVESISPLLGLYAARTRQDLDGLPRDGWSSEQCLDANEALLGYTAWTGRAVGVPQWGNLQPGSRADITVLDVDPLRDPPRALLRAKVLRTIVEGRSVFRAR
jgi:predicted amidohydrolase YtcJ